MNSSNTEVINSPVGVPGQRRLYFARLDVIKSHVASPIIPIPSSQHVSIRGKGHTVDCFVAPQGRANGLPCCRVPDPHGPVVAAASNILACRGEAHTIHIIAAQRNKISTNSQKKAFYTRGWDVPVPGQGRANGLACCRVPDPDCPVGTA